MVHTAKWFFKGTAHLARGGTFGKRETAGPVHLNTWPFADGSWPERKRGDRRARMSKRGPPAGTGKSGPASGIVSGHCSIPRRRLGYPVSLPRGGGLCSHLRFGRHTQRFVGSDGLGFAGGGLQSGRGAGHSATWTDRLFARP